MAKEKQNMMGPAISASSIICSSTRRKGLRTVMDLTRICEKFTPNSERFKHSFVYVRRVPFEVTFEVIFGVVFEVAFRCEGNDED